MEEEPVQLVIDLFQWDEVNIEHLWRDDHKVSVAMAEEARNNEPLFFPNKPGRSASHVMIGITDDGEHLLIAIVEVEPKSGAQLPAGEVAKPEQPG